MRQKLEEIQNVNSGLSRKLSCYSLQEDITDVLLTFRVFDKMLREAFSLSHKFTKVLIDLIFVFDCQNCLLLVLRFNLDHAICCSVE